MSNNKLGGQKLRERMIAKHGSEEAWKAHMRAIAVKGGAGSRGYKFAHGKVDPKEASKLGASKGGKKSKRTKPSAYEVQVTRAEDLRDGMREDGINV